MGGFPTRRRLFDTTWRGGQKTPPSTKLMAHDLDQKRDRVPRSRVVSAKQIGKYDKEREKGIIASKKKLNMFLRLPDP